MYAKLVISLLALLLAGCAAFAPAQSLDQRIAYGYGSHTAVLEAAANLVEFGDLTADQGQAVLELADRARLVLDTARFALDAGDPRTAEGQLALALGILQEIQNYLRRQQ